MILLPALIPGLDLRVIFDSFMIEWVCEYTCMCAAHNLCATAAALPKQLGLEALSCMTHCSWFVQS